MSESQALTLRVPKAQHEKLRRISYVRNTSIAELLRDAVEAIPDVMVEVVQLVEAPR